LAQVGHEARADRVTGQLLDSAQYIEHLESILQDRETHRLLLSTARNYAPSTEAICVEPFHNLKSADEYRKNLSPDSEKLRQLYELFDCQPDLVIHINPSRSNFAIKGVTNVSPRLVTLGLACDYLVHCNITQYLENLSIPVEDIKANYLVVEPQLLVPWYKDSVRHALKMTNESTWMSYLHPSNSELKQLDSFL
jgi:hypothetical protein